LLINEIMINYVRGGDRAIARGRCMDKPEIGGYGLIDANTMNTSIKASWPVRWIREGDWQDYPSLWLQDLIPLNRAKKPSI
jgi:hypothetical protein